MLSTATVAYRKAEMADIPALARLPRVGEAGGDSEYRMSRYFTCNHHPQLALMPRVIWTAQSGGSPIGYIAGHLTRRFGCDGELQWIYVVREHRRSGVASRLLRLLSEWFVEQGARRICVDVGDDSARPFYVRYGALDLSKHWMVWNDIAQIANPGLSRTGLERVAADESSALSG
jgi:GNAT superfamily N-acetyltransferase